MTGECTPIIGRFFRAMQTGATAEDEMTRLFAMKAVYIEPFSGRRRQHDGRTAIIAAMREGWREALPEMRIEVDTVVVEGRRMVARWTCCSPAIPGGSGRGENVFDLDDDGLIIRLETRLV